MCSYIPILKHYKINFGYEMYLDILPSKLTCNNGNNERAIEYI